MTPVHLWEYPEGPWQRLYIDFAGPFEGKTFLVVVDAFTKWPEVAIMTSTTTEASVNELHYIFARWEIVTDNGPLFVSKMFQRFTSSNDIKHIKSSPYQPATNGLAERFVQTLKQALRVTWKDNISFQHRLASFLMNYRNARHSTTETAPAYLMMGRELRCWLHLLKPDLRGTVSKTTTQQVMTDLRQSSKT